MLVFSPADHSTSQVLTTFYVDFISSLYPQLLLHGYVPDSFGSGIVIPLVKDKCGDMSSVDNYRPITLSPVISKIFESV